jgi:putative molybdopterin biosynthesis protein
LNFWPSDERMSNRKQYLSVLSKDDAQRAWADALDLRPLSAEEVPLAQAYGRVLAAPFAAPGDLPPFDRAVVDGYALVARDTFGAAVDAPVRLRLDEPPLSAGDDPAGRAVVPGVAIEIATGASIPAGADAVVMIEHTEREGDLLVLREPLVPGQGIQRRGTDVEEGEGLFAAGQRLSARETCVIAGLGTDRVLVHRRPRVAVISTGDELRAPGHGPLAPGQIFDANARLVADMVRDLGGEPVELGIAEDDPAALEARLDAASACDAVVLSGGTSKGSGDLTYRLVEARAQVVVHGVAIRPGKPLVLASWNGKPLAILPGFPTSAAVTFDVFVRPALELLAGLPPAVVHARGAARLGVATPSSPGRHDYVLCYLANDGGDGPPRAFPLLKGSGATSGLARADGWLEIPADREHVPAGALLPLTWLRGPGERAGADLVVVGEAAPAVDALLTKLTGLRARFLPASPVAAVDAVAGGFADAAVVGAAGEVEARAQGLGVTPLARRSFGLAARVGAPLEGDPRAALAAALTEGARLARARKGSDARAQLDGLLAGGPAPALPPLDVGSPAAVARAIASSRADVGVTTDEDARASGLAFLPFAEAPLVLVVGQQERPAREALLRAARC